MCGFIGVGVIVVCNCWLLLSTAHADVFERNAHRSEALEQATKADYKGNRYLIGFDIPLQSSLSAFDYNENAQPFAKSTVERGSIKNAISAQIQSPLFGATDIDGMMNRVRNDRLMHWQYAAPAVADAYKHYQMMGQMRLGMVRTDMARDDGGFLDIKDALQSQSRRNCFNEQIKNTAGVIDVVKTYEFCQEVHEIFKYFDYPASGKIRVFERVFNKLRLQGQVKERVLAVLPEVILWREGFEVKSPLKRIGDLFNDYQEAYRDHFANHRYEDMSRADVTFNESMMTDVLMNTPEEQGLMVEQMASAWGYSKTLEDYHLAAEWIERAQWNPFIDKAFKVILSKASSYLNAEVNSFKAQQIPIDTYAHTVKALYEHSQRVKEEFLEKNL